MALPTLHIRPVMLVFPCSSNKISSLDFYVNQDLNLKEENDVKQLMRARSVQSELILEASAHPSTCT